MNPSLKLWIGIWMAVILVVEIALGSSAFYSPIESGFSYFGRVERGKARVRFDWPGIKISFGFQGTSLTMYFVDDQKNPQGQNAFNVFIDGTFSQVLNLTFGTSKYVVASSLPDAPHQVVLTKRTEAFLGITAFGGIIVEGSNPQLLAPPSNSQRKLEFIGDSLTCGYGDEGKYPCHYSSATENNYNSWDGQLARLLSADYFVEAWSGKGLVRNYGDPNVVSSDPFPIYYNRTLGNLNNPNTTWDFVGFSPDAVVINLGTNDYSTQPNPPKNVFEPAYQKFINMLRTHYKTQPIFVVCGPVISNPCCQYVQDIATANKGNNVYYINMQNILKFPDDFGCDDHPNVQGSAKMAHAAYPTIKAVLGW